MTLGWEVTPRLAPALGLPSSNSIRISYVDIIPRLRELASNCVEMQLKSRKQDIVGTLKLAEGLKHFGSFENFEERKCCSGFANVGEATETCNKALEGCVLELTQLWRVWKEVGCFLFQNVSVGIPCRH